MKRNYTIDTLRTISTLLVILLHVAAPYVTSGIDNKSYDTSFWIGNVVDSYSRVCVPIFVLISGRFLLGRQETFLQFYKNRASRILMPLLAWSVIYIIYRAILRYNVTNSFDITNAIKSIMHGTPFYHMWYLYMLIGLYLVTPILNNNISKLNRKNLCIISIIFLIIGMFNSSYDMILGNKPLFILWFVNYLGYFVLGFVMEDAKYKISAILLFIIFLISGFMISILTFYFKIFYFYGYLTPFVIISSLSVYILFEKININENVLSRISHLTLGIYLVHAGVLDVILIILKNLNIQLFDNAIIGIPIKFFLTLIISTLIAYLFHRSKFLKKII